MVTPCINSLSFCETPHFFRKLHEFGKNNRNSFERLRTSLTFAGRRFWSWFSQLSTKADSFKNWEAACGKLEVTYCSAYSFFIVFEQIIEHQNKLLRLGSFSWQRALCLVRMSQNFTKYVSTSNSDYKLTKALINMKPTPVTPARIEVLEKVPTTELP